MNRSFLVAICIIIQLLVTAGCSYRSGVTDNEQTNPEEKIVVKFSHVVAENTPKGLAAQRFADIIAQRTNGRVEVQVFPNSTLYADGEEIEALLENAVQIIAPTTSKISGLFPRWQIFDLPYAFSGINAVHKAIDGDIGRILSEDLKAQNLLVLAFWDNGFKQVTNNTRPLVNPEDFYGLTFRVMINSDVLKEQFKLLGAQPVELPFNNVYKALQTGQVNSQENTMSNIYSKKFYQLQPYITISNHGYMGYVVITNKTFWDNLPGDIKSIFSDAMKEVTIWERKIAAELNEQNLNDIKELTEIQIHELSAEERIIWKKTFEPLYYKFQPVIGEDLLKKLEELE